MEKTTDEKLMELNKFLHSSTISDIENVYRNLEHNLLVNPDIPIYITGVEGHQRKSELKSILTNLGFTSVFQRNEMYSKPYNEISEHDDELIDRHARALFSLVGPVIDFGTLYIPVYNISIDDKKEDK